ncbi:MAG TPA: class I SAM-dependent methyltransferase [Thermoanaerobaculia bacterium]|jgi:demethylmenaquinone methyltransferase/2-methoxy-6-polyprenyl-1,4-benzoquinol methylase
MTATPQQQIDYYRARAGEYDQWFYRQGRYDRGPELNQRWFAEAEAVAGALDAFQPTGSVLELACGTGIWTERLLRHADDVTAVDASPEMLALNRRRLQSARVSYLQADLFAWEPSRQFDVVFFGFWLSHVPPERFSDFWALVRRALRPRGRFFLVDSRYEPSSTALDHPLPDAAAITSTRRLNDGREFQIYKIFYDPADLQTRLERLGWSAAVAQTDTYFIYAQGSYGEHRPATV